ncbi:excalibur calcium-binding domain-containing protein [Streptomyces sp. NPDC015131]|uniref:excalibur calcium-binding domain-containing protein n=1 Tax=Streptomyces sp. NPDC015131 TaxID=3364941 RepID=UPI0036FBFD20
MKRVWAGGLLLLMIGTGCGAVSAEDGARPATKAAPAPTVTVTATAAPAPAVTVTATATATVTATATATTRVTVAPAPAPPADTSTDTSTESDAGGDTYYANCAAARAAGAAPVHRGDPGYARHLDRDNDGVGCDNG